MSRETRNYTTNPVISLTPTESKTSLSNQCKSPHLIQDDLKQDNISSDDEREFEKFIMQTVCNTGDLDTDPETMDYDADLSIISFISPQINKMKSTKIDLSSALSKAKSSFSTYNQVQTHFNQTHFKYETKRERLRKIYREYTQYEKELNQLEEELKRIKKRIEKKTKTTNASNNKLFHDIEIFNEYYNHKSEELDNSLNRVKEYKENNDKRNTDLLKREQELAMRQKKLVFIQQEIAIKEKELNINQHDNENDNKQSGDWNFNDNLNTQEYYNENNNEDKEAVLELLNQQIITKNEELEVLHKKTANISQETINKLSELNERLASADRREKEIAILQLELEKKLTEVKEKLLETQIISQDLQMKEDYINSLRITNKSFDHKLSNYEINQRVIRFI